MGMGNDWTPALRVRGRDQYQCMEAAPCAGFARAALSLPGATRCHGLLEPSRAWRRELVLLLGWGD